MNTIRKTHPGHWAEQTTQFADLRAGVSHRQEEGGFVFPEHDPEDIAHPVALGRVLLAYFALVVAVIAAVKYFVTGAVL